VTVAILPLTSWVTNSKSAKGTSVAANRNGRTDRVKRPGDLAADRAPVSRSAKSRGS
jgi:hypothetical protein